MVAALNITEATANVGDTINVTGTGYTADEDITFTFNGVAINAVEGVITSDGTGAWSASFVVPEVPAGARTLVGTDETLLTAQDDVTITPEITLDPTTASPTDTVTISGTGFAASEDVTITFDGDPIVTDPATVTTDVDGSFSCDIVVPAVAAGNYDVVATDESLNTDTASLTVITVPAAPVLDTATATSDTQIDLDWTAGATGGSAITGYKIERNLNSAGWTTLVADTGNTDTDYSDTTLSTGDEADYRVSAINAVGTGAASNVLGDTTFTVPAAPVLTLVDTNITSLEINWTTPDDGGDAIDHYVVEWSVNSDFSDSDTDNVAFGTNIYTIASLTTGTPYYVRVYAVNPVGDGANSNTVTGTPQIPSLTFTPKPDKSEIYNKSYFYNDGITIPVNNNNYEDQAIIDFRRFKKLILQMLCTHGSNGLTYEVRGILHEGDNEVPPTDTAGIKKWEIIHADVAVAIGASSVKVIETDYSYILIRVKRTTSGQDSEGQLRAKVLQ